MINRIVKWCRRRNKSYDISNRAGYERYYELKFDSQEHWRVFSQGILKELHRGISEITDTHADDYIKEREKDVIRGSYDVTKLITEMYNERYK